MRTRALQRASACLAGILLCGVVAACGSAPAASKPDLVPAAASTPLKATPSTPPASEQATPEGRIGATVGVDRATGDLLAFGGYRKDGSPLPGLWTWSAGGGWREKASGYPVIPRAGIPLVADAGGAGAFVGPDGNRQMWRLSGTAWSPVATYPGNAIVQGVYDEALHRAVYTGPTYGHDWETYGFDGSRWTSITTAAKPPFRHEFGLAADPVHGYVILFGGVAREGGPDAEMRDTWLFDGASWKAVTTPTIPDGGFAYMAFDKPTKTIVLATASGLSYTWTGEDWKRQAGATAPRRLFATAFQDAAGRACLFGGKTALSPGELTETYMSDIHCWNGNSWLRVA